MLFLEPSRKKFRAVSRFIGYKGVAGVKTCGCTKARHAKSNKESQGTIGNYRESQSSCHDRPKK